MKKIIVSSNTKKRIKHCEFCSCVFSYEKEDLINNFYVECPHCRRTLNVFNIRGVKLPDNATNKDVFCSLFPLKWDEEYSEEEWESFWSSPFKEN